MEIDHIFICTDKHAPAGDLLARFGLTEGSSNIHEGQGTANRRFYFHNIMIELLWVNDLEEVQSERTKPMRLYERCYLKKKETSPFGMAFRPTEGEMEMVLFQTWDYHPIYLPDSLKIQVAENTPLTEPMFFYLPFATRQEMVPVEKREPMKHLIPLREVTNATVHIYKEDSFSDAAHAVNEMDKVSVIKDIEHFLELEFDGGEKNQVKDFRPFLPLIFKW